MLLKTSQTDKYSNSKIDSKVMAKPNHSNKMCYKCGWKDHIQRNCKIKEKVAMATQQNGNQNLENETGATCMMHLLSDSIENNHLKLATGETLPIISGACVQRNFRKKSNLPVVVGREKLLIGSAVSRTHSLLISHRNEHKSRSLTS